MWLGAFLSFTGSMIQNVAQGYFVYQLTGDPAKLAMVTFFMMVPVSVFGPILGVLPDMFDKRRILVVCMSVSAIGPLFLAAATWQGFAQYWHFIVVALVAGFVQCIEVPTRQSIIRSLVTPEDLPSAIPAQAATFNMARLIGPAIGGLLSVRFGESVCFLINGLSFSALALSVLSVRTDLRPLSARVEPIRDLILEGVRYTLQDRSLRLLFILESATSVFGAFYLALNPAIAKNLLGLDQAGLGLMMSFIGIGSLLGLVSIASVGHRQIKRNIVLVAMTTVGLAVFLLGFASSPWMAFPLMSLLGAAMISQFNTTNTLFQIMSPPALRGRVISMHMWAISGIAPLGVFVFGLVAKWHGLRASLWIGGGILVLIAVWGWTQIGRIKEPDPLANGAT